MYFTRALCFAEVLKPEHCTQPGMCVSAFRPSRIYRHPGHSRFSGIFGCDIPNRGMTDKENTWGGTYRVAAVTQS